MRKKKPLSHQEAGEETSRQLHRRNHGASCRRMGDAGAIISGGKGTAAEKMKSWRQRCPSRKEPG